MMYSATPQFSFELISGVDSDRNGVESRSAMATAWATPRNAATKTNVAEIPSPKLNRPVTPPYIEAETPKAMESTNNTNATPMFLSWMCSNS